MKCDRAGDAVRRYLSKKIALKLKFLDGFNKFLTPQSSDIYGAFGRMVEVS